MRRTTVAVLGVVLVLAAGGLSRAGTPPAPQAPPAAPVAAPTVQAGGSVSTPAAPKGTSNGLSMDGSPPVRVAIPRLRVASDLVGLALLDDGTMEVPDDAATVGWYTGAPPPGSTGPAILAGHVNWQGRDGAFAKLATLAAGDEVRVERLDGSVAVFAVTSLGHYPKNRFPTDAVYGPIDHAGLRLITCGGEFDRATGHYRDNIVVWADFRRAE